MTSATVGHAVKLYERPAPMPSHMPLPPVKAGDQQTFTHICRGHHLMTIRYQCLYVLPKHARLEVAKSPEGNVTEYRDMTHGLKILREVIWRGHVTQNHNWYVERYYWPLLGEQSCELCGQRLDGEGS